MNSSQVTMTGEVISSRPYTAMSVTLSKFSHFYLHYFKYTHLNFINEKLKHTINYFDNFG